MIDSQRTREVIARFQEGLHQKLMTSVDADALSNLEAAYELARSPRPLTDIWPSATAYRLAHLLMRCASSLEELRRVDDLLSAATDDACAPVPIQRSALIIRIAVLSRLAVLEPDEVILAQRQKCFEEAVRLLRLHAGAGSPTMHAPAEQSIQSSALNLLELAAYFTGMNYQMLEGAGVPVHNQIEPHITGEAWRIVGTHGLSDELRYSHELASNRIKILAEHGAVDVAFVATAASGEILYPRNSRIKPPPPKAAYKLLALVCAHTDGVPREKLPSDNLNSNFYRLRNALTAILDRSPDEELFFCDRASDRYRLAPSLRVIGMVPGKLLS